MAKRRFAIIPSSAILIHAEANGLSLTDQAASLLAEDVSYRLRDVTHAASELMRSSKRRKLSVDDFNRCLKLKHLEPHYEFGCNEGQPFKQVQVNGETTYFYDDKEVALKDKVFESRQLQFCPTPSMRVHWLNTEGAKSLHAKKERQSDENEQAIELNDALKEYYTVLCKGVLSLDQEVFQTTLEELKTSSSVAAVLPHLVSFLTKTLPTFLQDITESFEGVYAIVRAIRALASNKHIHLVPHLPDLVGLTMKCATDPKMKSRCEKSLSFDHWMLRSTAAQTTAQLVKLMGIISSDIERQVLSTYEQHLEPSNALSSLYGAVLGIAAFGVKAIQKYFLPHFRDIHQEIELKGESTDVQMSREAIKRTVFALLRSHREVNLSGETGEVRETVRRLDEQFREIGDESSLPKMADLYESVYAVHGDGCLPCFYEWEDLGDGDSDISESDSDGMTTETEALLERTGRARPQEYIDANERSEDATAQVQPDLKPVRFELTSRKKTPAERSQLATLVFSESALPDTDDV